jgi:peptide/nickel transport system permease protein
MLPYISRRLLALIPTLFFVSLIVFVTVRLIPGSVIDLMLSQNDIAVGKDRAKLEAALGLDRPMYVQYVRWAGAAAIRPTTRAALGRARGSRGS